MDGWLSPLSAINNEAKYVKEVGQACPSSEQREIQDILFLYGCTSSITKDHGVFTRVLIKNGAETTLSIKVVIFVAIKLMKINQEKINQIRPSSQIRGKVRNL